MEFFRWIEHIVRISALQLPLEIFVLVGSFFEEIISPIPSALIMGTAGSLALLHHEPLWYLVWLAMIGNIGKATGALLYYFAGDKLEDVFITKLTKFFGINHQDIESIGKRFVGHHWKDGGLLFLLRLIPFFPTLPVSLTAGIIKMDIRVFLVATYFGNFFKDLFYLYAGYAGLAKLHTLWREIGPVKMEIDILVAVLIIVFFFFLYIYRGSGKRIVERVHNSIYARFITKE